MRLFGSWREEQTVPEQFYGALAQDTVHLIERHEPLGGRTLVDIGAGRPEFGTAFTGAGARYVAVDLDPSAFDGTVGEGFVVGRAEQLPLADDSVDVAVSSNVVEHVRDQGALGEEMLRVVKPGGLVFISFTTWHSPWGGHETSPWHYLGGDYAARRYERRIGRQPKNRFGDTMFPAHAGQALRWARAREDAWLVEAIPRYHPDWASSVIAVPGLREVFAWNLMLVLRKS